MPEISNSTYFTNKFQRHLSIYTFYLNKSQEKFLFSSLIITGFKELLSYQIPNLIFYKKQAFSIQLPVLKKLAIVFLFTIF